jgi:hypothetical protein
MQAWLRLLDVCGWFGKLEVLHQILPPTDQPVTQSTQCPAQQAIVRPARVWEILLLGPFDVFDVAGFENYVFAARVRVHAGPP